MCKGGRGVMGGKHVCVGTMHVIVCLSIPAFHYCAHILVVASGPLVHIMHHPTSYYKPQVLGS